ncbi:peptidylprolyl isomerase [Methylomagnum ishizawai]|uniref:peptidylprolyl isomerase n=1 Tax=Methylomagnum ishizawai TaxID=1760988 RepID=UPI001C33DB54|nr:peptidylprolyl isomerase [Methylomagnum ishizawai]BBL74052.1 peptidyl-prolyl cis-trans isomerase B [Methylomagnum ishizawai]
MRVPAALFLCALGLTLNCQAADKPKPQEKPKVTDTSPQVKLETSLGEIVIKLDAAKAPATVQNFLAYVKEGHYNGTIFHRVIPGFMAQGGGFTADFTQKPTHAPIKNEADNGLKNLRGTLAMARTPDPDSASAQFFINYKDNGFLDFKSKTPQGWGYAVFGEVTSGMDVVDKMATIPTGNHGPYGDVPKTPITIEKASVIGE